MLLPYVSLWSSLPPDVIWDTLRKSINPNEISEQSTVIPLQPAHLLNLTAQWTLGPYLAPSLVSKKAVWPFPIKIVFWVNPLSSQVMVSHSEINRAIINSLMQKKKILILGPIFGYVFWLVKTRLHDFFQIYRPINTSGPPIWSAQGDIHGEIPQNRILAITFYWSVPGTSG